MAHLSIYQSNKSNNNNNRRGGGWPLFIVLNLFLFWLLHAVAFFSHEFAHSFTAFIAGWKKNPFALNYGRPTIANILLQFDIDENVDYTPIFNSDNGAIAAIIAVAGMLVGNAFIDYPIARTGLKRSIKNGSRGWGLFFYWFWVTCVGNFISYVPVRTFTTHGDMYTVCKGLHCSPWLIIVVLGIPLVYLLVHFIVKVLPSAASWLYPGQTGKQVFIIVLTSLILFGFYGIAGIAGQGQEAHIMSVLSACFFAPVTIAVSVWRVVRRGKFTSVA